MSVELEPYSDVAALRTALDGIATVRTDGLELHDAAGFRAKVIDRLVASAVFGDDELRSASRWLIRAAAPELGAFLASIHDLYIAGGQGIYQNATAPAINVRGLTYDVARTIFRAARTSATKIVLFEIARSEMGYTEQRPAEYAAAVLAAAIKESHQGPVFVQGDHFQANAKNYAKAPAEEIAAVRELALEAITAGFYNIDIDASTLVDLSLPNVTDQQKINADHSFELTAAIREAEPEGITISIGGEIGEVGSQNSTVEELHAFMESYTSQLATRGNGERLTGISKISVQTGTSHGGVPLPDGSVAEVNVDFATLAKLSRVAREEYGLGGAVQHGASTLPPEAFDRFAEANAIEVHLATAFQNQMYDSSAFPADLKEAIYTHLAANHADERKPNQTDAQFYYTTRKRGFGPFKQRLWSLPAETRAEIMADLEPSFELVMRRLGVAGSADLVDKTIKRVDVPCSEAPERLRETVAR